MDEKPKLKFHRDGSFKIMQIADTQEIPDISRDTLRLLDAAIRREQPDLIVFTGDQIKGYGVTFRGKTMRQKVSSTIDGLLFPIVSRGIPFAVTFGNHDKQVGLSNLEQMELYTSYCQCVSYKNPEAPDGLCHHLPIYDSSGEKPAFYLYLINSNGDAKGGGYETVSQEQIDWYRKTRDSLASKNGGTSVPSLVFQHIPVPEFYQLLKKVDARTPNAVRAYRTHKNEYFLLDDHKVWEKGLFKEPPSIPDTNTGEFEAMAEKGDVLGIYVGHDHNNAFVGTYQNIDLGYTPGCGFNVYGPSVDRAVRVFELNEHRPREYKTHTVSYRELFGTRVAKPVKEFFFVHSPTTVDAAVPMIGKGIGIVAGAAAAVASLCILLRKK